MKNTLEKPTSNRFLKKILEFGTLDLNCIQIDEIIRMFQMLVLSNRHGHAYF